MLGNLLYGVDLNFIIKVIGLIIIWKVILRPAISMTAGKSWFNLKRLFSDDDSVNDPSNGFTEYECKVKNTQTGSCKWVPYRNAKATIGSKYKDSHGDEYQIISIRQK